MQLKGAGLLWGNFVLTLPLKAEEAPDNLTSNLTVKTGWSIHSGDIID